MAAHGEKSWPSVGTFSGRPWGGSHGRRHILRCSRDTDTMTVADLLLSQRGWGPRRCSKLLRSVSVSETATLGSLTERQRVMLAAVLSSPEKKERTIRTR